MKKGMNILAGIMLAAALLLFPRQAVSAAGENHTIEIHSATQGHTYEAYQVFSGNFSGGVLTDVEWGSGLKNSQDGNSLLDALKENDSLKDYFADCESASDVAEKLAEQDGAFMDDSSLLDAFAETVSGCLSSTKAVSGAPEGNAASGYTYTINGLDDGYYFIKETALSAGNETGNAYTKFILQVMGKDVEINAKAEAPKLEKKIDGDKDTDLENRGEVSANNAAIGDVIPYKLTSRVPVMDGYETYYFVVEDTLSAGLTFVEGSVSVRIGEKDLSPEKDFTVEKEPETVSGQQQTLRIILKNFIQYREDEGKEILLTYSARLNEHAAVGTIGNKNAAKLIYSNNPNENAGGDPDKPGPDSPTGETPQAETYTYVTGLKLIKTDMQGRKLTGATFQLEGSRINQIVVYRDVFTEDPQGNYWKLKDGTYTDEAPVTDGGPGDNSSQYDSTEKKYQRDTVKKVVSVTQGVQLSETVNSDGELRFDGLAAGTYTITEVKAPDGYNLLKEPVEITIEWEAPSETSAACVWKVSGKAGGEKAVIKDGVAELTIANESGLLLPSTGGSGTDAFYVLGGLLAAAGVFLLAVNLKRKARE